MRRTSCPAWRRAKAQLKSAVRAPPTCRNPVGLGAKRVRTVTATESSRGRRPAIAGRGRLCYPHFGAKPLFFRGFPSPRAGSGPAVKIAVDRLTPSPQAFDFEAGTAWWRSVVPAHRDLPAELEEPFRVSASAYRMGDDVLLEGEVQGG